MTNHIAELNRRHQALEKALADEQRSAAGSTLRIAELKRQKLMLKDEIEALQARSQKAASQASA
jgi:hypothetical protein